MTSSIFKVIRDLFAVAFLIHCVRMCSAQHAHAQVTTWHDRELAEQTRILRAILDEERSQSSSLRQLTSHVR